MEVMSVEARRRTVLKNLFHVTSSMNSKYRADDSVLVQVTANFWPENAGHQQAKRKSPRVEPALPYQRRVERAIGHITGLRASTPVSRRRFTTDDYSSSKPYNTLIRHSSGIIRLRYRW